MMKVTLPKWLRRAVSAPEPAVLPKLPAWAKADTSGASIIIRADTDGAMREWFALLGNPVKDQYWLEVAYQCAKLDLQAAIAGTKFDPRAGKVAEFRFSRADNWAQHLNPVGRGSALASKGKEARAHYIRVRGALPM